MSGDLVACGAIVGLGLILHEMVKSDKNEYKKIAPYIGYTAEDPFNLRTQCANAAKTAAEAAVKAQAAYNTAYTAAYTSSGNPYPPVDPAGQAALDSTYNGNSYYNISSIAGENGAPAITNSYLNMAPYQTFDCGILPQQKTNYVLRSDLFGTRTTPITYSDGKIATIGQPYSVVKSWFAPGFNVTYDEDSASDDDDSYSGSEDENGFPDNNWMPHFE